MGKIVLEGMEFYAFHGYYEQETKIGNRFVVDIEIQTDLQKPAQTDKLSQTINYEIVYDMVKNEMAKPSKLIEHIGYRIKTALQDRFPAIDNLLVRISKYNPPMGGKITRTYVEL